MVVTVFLILVGVYVVVLATLLRVQPELMRFLVLDPRGRTAVSLMAGIYFRKELLHGPVGGLPFRPLHGARVIHQQVPGSPPNCR
ncbi:hypothetical protein SY88_02245 [Clostridiales bacterium PH28_bin88]|nr:hypothetical protein SY88_02245 [Clostridiales bacterium PH28_bin88]